MTIDVNVSQNIQDSTVRSSYVPISVHSEDIVKRVGVYVIWGILVQTVVSESVLTNVVVMESVLKTRLVYVVSSTLPLTVQLRSVVITVMIMDIVMMESVIVRMDTLVQTVYMRHVHRIVMGMGSVI